MKPVPSRNNIRAVTWLGGAPARKFLRPGLRGQPNNYATPFGLAEIKSAVSDLRMRQSGRAVAVQWPICSHGMRTRGDMLSFAIAFALRGARKLVRGLRHELTEEERYRVANDVVHRLKEYGDPWRLSDELPPPGKGHST
jgi:hypothetical protein